MAITPILRVAHNVGTSPVTLYTAPAATTTRISGITLCNISANPITVDVAVTDSSAAVTSNITKTMSIPVGQTVTLGGADVILNLETGDSIAVTASAATSLDVTLSGYEFT